MIESRWGRDFPSIQTSPGAHPASCTMGTGTFLGVKRGQGVTLTPHPLLVPRSRQSAAIPLLPLWTVRPVQSLSACTRMHFTFFIFEPVKVKVKWSRYRPGVAQRVDKGIALLFHDRTFEALDYVILRFNPAALWYVTQSINDLLACARWITE